MSIDRPIQRDAPGLLSYYNLKNQGRLPDALESTVQPIYVPTVFQSAIPEIVRQVQNLASGFLGFTNCITIPNNEVWLVHDLISVMSLADISVNDAEYYIAMAETNNGFITPLSDYSTSMIHEARLITVVPGALEQMCRASYWPWGRAFAGGTQLGVFVTMRSGAAVVPQTMQVRFDRLLR